MHQVELFPSGRRFAVAAGQTILDAALVAGITVPYQCANGSCGNCRARIIEGRLAESGHSDYVFTGNDRLHPMLLMCTSQPATDMLIEAVLMNEQDDIPHQQVTTTVKDKTLLSDDVMLLTLRTPRSKTLRFLAGHRVELQFPDAEICHKSIASCPCNGRDLQFHFRRKPGDICAEYVFDTLKPHDSVEIQGPCGGLVFDESSQRPVIMIAYDTGFSAMKSLIEHMISLDAEQDIYLIWLLPANGDAYLQNQCRAWHDALVNFNYAILDSTNSVNIYKAININQIRIENHDIYISAPIELTHSLQNLLLENGAQPERISMDLPEQC
jgi:CDP-4-dehydro-6-deoxyglucose reductase